ncbi:hypothetical protein ACIGXM_14340 [Kitasatospora sp. NPDC052896]|uniref:phage tail fiber protein n=1 Tax=Kitasatospora sp. NPDC052896 TaxID=3364061 RepID=UPI0037C4FAA6
MSGFIALSGALSDLAYLAGQSSLLDAEWAAKSQGGDAQPKTSYLMLLGSTVVDGQTAMATLASLEVSGTGYARQPIPWAAPDSGSRSISNSVLIQFGPFADPSGLNTSVQAAAMVTRMTGSNGLCLMTWNLASPLTTVQNQALQIAVGSLSMSLSTS